MAVEGVRIEGVKELVENLRKLSADERLVFRAVVAGASTLKAQAKALALSQGLKRSGALINNIAIKRERAGPGMVQYNLGVRHGKHLAKKARQNKRLALSGGRIVQRVVNDPFYWMFHEFGTAKMAASPFIGPALLQGREAALAAMQRSAERSIKRLAKGAA